MINPTSPFDIDFHIWQNWSNNFTKHEYKWKLATIQLPNELEFVIDAIASHM